MKEKMGKGWTLDNYTDRSRVPKKLYEEIVFQHETILELF
jgi:hypothetical protein